MSVSKSVKRKRRQQRAKVLADWTGSTLGPSYAWLRWYGRMYPHLYALARSIWK